MWTRTQSPEEKSLQINLQAQFYGTIAEIGGGQEVARTFFRAGGASGTIAKTISAYDKTVSDNIYGSGVSERYVSEKRLLQMLDREYKELLQTFEHKHVVGRKYFVFANTVETLNYFKTNQGHGWLGVRFQHAEHAPASTVVMHVLLHETDTLLQQQTLGIIGVNLIHACFYLSENIDDFLNALMDNLDRYRIEINMLRTEGPVFEHIDNRLLSVMLVQKNLTNATIFDRYKHIQQPGDFFYKKNVILLRGSFRPITYVGFDMLKQSYAHFKQNPAFSKENTLQVCEITLNNLLSEGSFDAQDFLDRVNLLNGMGQNVMISNFQEFYRVSAYINSFKILNLVVVMGANIFQKLMQPQWYKDLQGGILEAMGILFRKNTVLYIYPYLEPKTAQTITSDAIQIDSNLKHLLNYLKASGRIVDLQQTNPQYALYSSAQVLQYLKTKNPEWEKMVPGYIRKNIKEQKLFGYQPE